MYLFINKHCTTCRFYHIHAGILINFGRLIMKNINPSVKKGGEHINSYSQSHSVHPQLLQRRGCDHAFTKNANREHKMSTAQQKSTERGMEGTMICQPEGNILFQSFALHVAPSFIIFWSLCLQVVLLTRIIKNLWIIVTVSLLEKGICCTYLMNWLFI